MKTLLELQNKLRKQKGLAGWMVHGRLERSNQLYLSKTVVESHRMTNVERFDITVYHGHEGQGQAVMGSALFTLDQQTLPLFDQELEKALFAASLVHNEPYALPSQEAVYPDPHICDKRLRDSPKEAIGEIQDAIFGGLSRQRGVRLSSAEVFLDHHQGELGNHLGLSATQEGTMITLELILLAGPAGAETEFITRFRRRLLKDCHLDAEIDRSAQLATDRLSAVIPPTGHFDVLLTDEALDHFFNPIVNATSGTMKYNLMNTNEVGKPVMDINDPKGETLTLWSNGLVPGSLGSSRYDSYGTPSGRHLLVENNVLKHFWANKRYADYLKIEPTGDFGTVEVACGSNLEEALLASGRLFQLLAFSVFDPNPLTGDFSAEIRMGYEVTPKGRRPIKGGAVSGTMQQAFEHIAFSKEQVQRENYLGPKAILCQNLTLAGE